MLPDWFYLDYDIRSAQNSVEKAMRQLKESQEHLASVRDAKQQSCTHVCRVDDLENIFGTKKWEITLVCKVCELPIQGTEENPRCTACAHSMRPVHRNDWRGRREELNPKRWIVCGSEPAAYRCTNKRCRELHVLTLRRELTEEEKSMVAKNGPVFTFPKGWPQRIKSRKGLL